VASSSVRRGLPVAAFPAALIGTLVYARLSFPPVAVAHPPVQCQSNFLKATPPGLSDTCAPTDNTTAPTVAAALPAGFQESVVWSGLTNPTTVRFAADGRVFVGEKSGVIKVFDNLADTTPTVFSGLVTNVQNFWDRGLLGLALDPSLTGGSGTGSYVYVLYTYDHILGTGGSAPQWGDACPGPPTGPGATTDGCVVSGRLSRFPVTGSTIGGPEQVLVEDWCQQFPSHSIGSLVFGPDGSLYVSGGDGASFNAVDYGQYGGTTSPVFTPKNPCGDPPNDAMSPPTAEGGALRSQDIRTSGTAATYRSVVMADSPVAYWRLGEASGATAVDSRGNSSGTYVASPTLAVAGAITGDSDTAVTFNGSTQKVTVADSTPFRAVGAASFSVEVWFKHTPGAGFQLLATSLSGVDDGWAMYSQADVFGWGRQPTSGADAYADHAGAVSAGIWHHAVGTFDGTNLRLYLDGALAAGPTASGGSLPSDSAFMIASETVATGTNWFNGTLDEVAFYNYALSATRVAAHYTAGTTGGGVGDPTGLNGAILRLNPATGAGMPGNPFAGSTDANARRIIAYGLRNPFRITTRPGTSELWVGDVGWNTWEEINRIPSSTDAVAENFGWPCYEGVGSQSGYDGANLNLCETLYAQGSGAVAAPEFTYNHSAQIVSGETCSTGSSSISGMAFYPDSGGSYPASYQGGLFFADYSRNCIWFIPKGTNGQPNYAARQTFVAPAAGPVDLVIGPGGDLFYVGFGPANATDGTIRRISTTGANQPPTAVIQATPTSGAAPLTVQFDGTSSSDPEGTALTYAWDLNGDGLYDDSTAATTSWTYPNQGNVTVGLRVTDVGGATGTASQIITVGTSPPVPVISTPTSALHWKVGDLISFSGSASDAQDGSLPASALSWSLVLQHCPSNCHTHVVQTWTGVASGSFNAPDHEYPSYLELTLTATDSQGSSASTTVRLDPQTVVLTFQTAPAGLSLAVNATSSVAPFPRTVIVGSANSVTATSPQSLNGLSYTFTSWSDGLAQSHTVVAPATNTTYTATYATNAFAVLTNADAYIKANPKGKNFGSATTLNVQSGTYRSYLKFTVGGLSAPTQGAKLRLWVTNSSNAGGSVYLVSSSWTEPTITWSSAPPISGSAIATFGAVTSGTWVELNLGTLITGNGTYTFAISGGSSDEADYASRETGNVPALIVTP
jgi:glucose/arabinose dehydrogenase